MMRNYCLPLVLLFAFCQLAVAELTIEITQGRDNPTLIAVVPFAWQGGPLSEDIAAIIDADLERTGQFKPLPRRDMLSTPHKQSEVFYRDWRALDVPYLLVGRIANEQGRIVAGYDLFDVLTQKKILSGAEASSMNGLRAIAHGISDKVYEQLTGIRGAFSTRILYVSAIKRGGRGEFTYRLLISDVDGANEKVLKESNEPILTPVWAPDGESIAYVSFETTRPAIYKQNLRTGQRQQLTNFRGLNGAPSFSPDGKKLALVLSKDGSPDIYVMDLATRQLKRVTKHYAIDTEPSWMPDGKSLIYTSDRGGRPQIYQVDLATGYEERLTFDGSYNARARVTPDGKGIIMVHRDELRGDFHIALMDIKRGTMQVLTDTALDESPSIAPNGAILLYATKSRGKGVLAAASLDGGVKFMLPSRFGDVREPAWSPFLK